MGTLSLLVGVQNGYSLQDSLAVFCKTKHTLIMLSHNPIIMLFGIYQES